MASTLDYFGIICIVIVIIQILRTVIPWFYQNFLGPFLIGSSVKLKEMGEWALITGATEGIGKAYAKALAKQGINVILVSRSLEKLENVASEIEAAYKVQTRVINIDFTANIDDNEIYKKVEKGIIGLEIGTLVNNVGLSYSNPEYFLKVKNNDELFSNIIKCNIFSVINMCKLVMPGMLERNRGCIINVSSLAAQIPNPMLTVYAASKAFVDKFSEDLATEYSKNGILVQSVLPGFVATNMSKIRKSTWMAPTPDTYVRSALRTLTIASHTTGYYPHALLKLFINIMEGLSPTITKRTTLKTMENIRARALRKVGSTST